MNIPAFFPPNYVPVNSGEESSSKYIQPSKIGDNETINFRLCGDYTSAHCICGYRYFTKDKQVRSFPTFPSDYEKDIGISYQARQNNTNELDRPHFFLAWTVYSKELKDFCILTITQDSIRRDLDRTFELEDGEDGKVYKFTEDGMANFYFSLTKERSKGKVSYKMMPTLKAPTKANIKDWGDARDSIYVPAIFNNGDPFAGPAAQGSVDNPGMPPTSRDDCGADTEINPIEESAW